MATISESHQCKPLTESVSSLGKTVIVICGTFAWQMRALGITAVYTVSQ